MLTHGQRGIPSRSLTWAAVHRPSSYFVSLGMIWSNQSKGYDQVLALNNTPLSRRKKAVTSMFSKFYCRAFLPLQLSIWKRISTRTPVQPLISQRSCSRRHSLSRFQVKIKQVAELQFKPFTQPDKTLQQNALAVSFVFWTKS